MNTPRFSLNSIKPWKLANFQSGLDAPKSGPYGPDSEFRIQLKPPKLAFEETNLLLQISDF